LSSFWRAIPIAFDWGKTPRRPHYESSSYKAVIRGAGFSADRTFSRKSS
jgi:hypothetical protein